MILVGWLCSFAMHFEGLVSKRDILKTIMFISL